MDCFTAIDFETAQGYGWRVNITLEYYGMQAPNYDKQCTYRIYNNNPASLCNNYKIHVNHHDALSDAKACAELFLIYLRNK